MATVKKNTSKKSTINDQKIITLYMDYVLDKNEAPSNVYAFCKQNEIDEADFYTFFGSFEALRKSIWVSFFENAITITNKDESYSTYSDKNKLLTLYFTLFEILTLNRSYVIFSMKDNHEGIKNLKDLKSIRYSLKQYIVEIIETSSEQSSLRIDKLTTPVFSEGAWIQFLFILKFWIDDNSKGFEKTDIIIEKSVNTVVDLLNTKPLESLFDLGKFLWKERKM